MKRYGNLYPQICAYENVMAAHLKARRGKRHYAEVKMVDANPDKYIGAIVRMLENRTYGDINYTKKTRYDGRKVRDIYVLNYYPHRIVQWAMANVLVPIWKPTLIRDTYSSIDGRGIHSASKRLRSWLADPVATRYCLKIDVRKFYPSIPHDVLKGIVRRKIKCRDTLWLMDMLIDSAPGVPIGNYLSQYKGNVTLSGLDHFIKEEMGVTCYMRYCDDMVFLSPDKADLRGIFGMVRKYLSTNLRLVVKDNYQVFPVDARGIDFLGYRFFHGYTLLRRSIAKRMRTCFSRIDRYEHKPRYVLSMVMSYLGWLRHCDGYHFEQSIITDAVVRAVARASARLGCANPLEVSNHGRTMGVERAA